LILFPFRYLWWLLTSVRRSLGKPPEYVELVLEDDLPLLPDPPRPFWQRFVSRPRLSIKELAQRFDAIARDRRIKGVVEKTYAKRGEAGVAFERPDFIEAARRSADAVLLPVLDWCLTAEHVLPFDISCTVLGLAAVGRATGSARYARGAQQARAWFAGRNAAGKPVYDPSRGIAGAFIGEWRRVLADRGVFSLLIIAPVFYGVFYPQPYLGQLVRKILIAVVDDAQQPRSWTAPIGSVGLARAPYVEEGFLHHVFRLAGTCQRAQGE